MLDDVPPISTYSAAMDRGEPHIILALNTTAPMELGAFVGAFASLGNEYERYIKATNPDLLGDPTMFVREIRPGSIEADLVPWLSTFAPFISEMDKALIVERFIRVWGGRFHALLGRGDADAPATRSELKDWADAVRGIATDPDASARIEAATFEDGERKITATFSFTSAQARKARAAIENRQRELENVEHADHERALMRFTRSDIGDVNVGRRSGERVVIEEISDRPLALIYGSELAESQIKHEIRDADENVFKKGFVVDVNVRFLGGQPAAYAITNLHQIIDLD